MKLKDVPMGATFSIADETYIKHYAAISGDQYCRRLWSDPYPQLLSGATEVVLGPHKESKES